MNYFKSIIVFLLLALPNSLFAQENKSLGMVIGGAVVAPLVIAIPASVGWGTDGMRLGAFAIGTIPMASHAYLGDNHDGLSFAVFKILANVFVFLSLSEYDTNDDNYLITGILGCSLLTGIYTYELIDLVKKTNQINKKADENILLSLYFGFHREKSSLGATLRF
ncbi:MAG: hypothetical protein NT056_08250 [Proteobacteria bacterium]|nr:hypothetical protein [Pseudomonadota bacterium]